MSSQLRKSTIGTTSQNWRSRDGLSGERGNMSMKRQKSPLVASTEYNNRTWPDGGIESFSEGDEPPMMMGTEALGNGNDHFGIHEQNQFCKQRGCVLFDVSGTGA